MKLAIIGLGHVAQYQLEAINQIKEIDLVAAHDIDSTRSQILPSGVLFFDEPESLISHSDIDLILVSTSNKTHYSLGKKVLQNKMPLLLEKPCCDSIEQMNELVDLAHQNNKLFMVAFHAAYGRDVLWYEDFLLKSGFNPGPITGFHAGFFDPYYENGHIVSSAKSLGGSWFDSGINALSVIGKFIELDKLHVVEGRMTRVSSLPCSEIQGAASFEFESDKHRGYGIIETNWSLGLNQKITQLQYALTDTQVILDHTNEQVTIKQSEKILKEEHLQTHFSRLTNHYINLFSDIVDMFNSDNTNLSYAVSLHQLLFEAMIKT